MSIPHASCTYSGAAELMAGSNWESMSFLTALMILCSVWLYWISEREGFIVVTLRTLHSSQAQVFGLLDLVNDPFLILVDLISFQAAHNMRATYNTRIKQDDVGLSFDLAGLGFFLVIGLR